MVYKRPMDTTSTIEGPSITLLWPLVGGSHASDWVRFSKSNQLSDNVSPKRAGIQPLSFLYIGNSLMYMYIKGQWTLPAPLKGPPSQFCGHLLAVLMPQIGSDFRNRTSCPTMYHQNVQVYNHSPSYILVIP